MRRHIPRLLRSVLEWDLCLLDGYGNLTTAFCAVEIGAEAKINGRDIC